MLRDDLLRGLLQISGAGVIAESFPKFVDFVRAGVRGGLDGGQFAHPALPVWNHSFDLRLLEHDFGNPDRVRIAGAAPRQVTRVVREPAEQRRNQPVQFRSSARHAPELLPQRGAKAANI